ncbi:hypothetical protein M9458_052632, partial [Cirrhinus mrigala]
TAALHSSFRSPLPLIALTSSSIPSIWSNCSDIRYSMLPANHRGISPTALITVSPSLSALHIHNDCALRPALALFNCRSLTNKATVLSTLLTEKDLDFLLLTETWQIPNDYFHLNLLTPSGYSYLAKPRLTSRGGGLAAVYRSNIPVKTIDFHATSTFEYLVLKISGTFPMIAILLYRPPKSMSNFFTELHELLTLTCAMSSSVILFGDFNIHVNKDCADSRELMSVFECLNLVQHIHFPTHLKGHTLDLICTPGLCNVSVYGSQIGLSDHLLIKLNCEMPLPRLR